MSNLSFPKKIESLKNENDVSKNKALVKGQYGKKQNKKMKSGYVGSVIGTRYYNDSPITDGLLDSDDPETLRNLERDMFVNDPTINAGIRLRCELFNLDFALGGDISIEEADAMKRKLVEAGISERLNKIMLCYYIYGEAVCYAFIDPLTKKLIITDVLDPNNYEKKTALLSNKTHIVYATGLLGKKEDIKNKLQEILNKLRNSLNVNSNNFKTNISSLSDLKDKLNDYEIESDEVFQTFREAVELEYGESFISTYLSLEYYLTQTIDIVSNEYPSFINDNKVPLNSKNIIFLQRGSNLPGGSSYKSGNKTNKHYTGIDGNKDVGSCSILRTLCKLWQYETIYFRSDATIIERRMSPITWISVGDENTIMEDSELDKIGQEFRNTNLDSSNGATFVTNSSVKSIQSVDTTAGFRSWIDIQDFLIGSKLRALGINEEWFSGSSTYNTYESVATTFGSQIANERRYLTTQIFTNVLLPLLSEFMGLYKYKVPNIKISIVPTKTEDVEIQEAFETNDVDNTEDNTKNLNVIIKDVEGVKDSDIDTSGTIDDLRIKVIDLEDLPNKYVKKEDTLFKIKIKKDTNKIGDTNNFEDVEVKITDLPDLLGDYSKSDESKDIKINIKQLKSYVQNNAEQYLKWKKLKSSNVNALSKSTEKELLIPAIEWENSFASESLDRIKGLVGILSTGWKLTPEFISHLSGINAADLEKFGCTKKENTNEEGVTENDLEYRGSDGGF